MGETTVTAGVIRVRYWAAAKAAAGTGEDELVVSGPLTVSEVRRRAVSEHPGPDSEARLASVLAACSVLIGDQPLGNRSPDSVLVEPGSSVEFLPPFAGG